MAGPDSGRRGDSGPSVAGGLRYVLPTPNTANRSRTRTWNWPGSVTCRPPANPDDSMGDYILTENDIRSQRPFPDAVAPARGHFCLHYPGDKYDFRLGDWKWIAAPALFDSVALPVLAKRGQPADGGQAYQRDARGRFEHEDDAQWRANRRGDGQWRHSCARSTTPRLAASISSISPNCRRSLGIEGDDGRKRFVLGQVDVSQGWSWQPWGGTWFEFLG